MESKVIKFISFVCGVFFLTSFLTKLISINDWLNFNYEFIGNNIGYINAIIILGIELFFGLQFTRQRITKNLLIYSFSFVLVLTLFVILNKNLFKVCMCFGSVIKIKPGWEFILKNSSLMIFLMVIYLAVKKKQLLSNLYI